MNIFKIIKRLLRNIKLASQNAALLDDIRASNPTSKIMNANLVNVTLGDSSAVLDGAYLNNVSMGRYSYVSNNTRLINVKLKSFCSIGPNVKIGLGPHPSKVFVSTYPAFYTNQNTGCTETFRSDKIFDDTVPQTNIGHDVWIGADVIIPGGVVVGNGAIIAAGSVVVKDVAPYSIVGGNPAKEIRKRFSNEQITLLQDVEWWNWPKDKIIHEVDSFADVEKFKEIVN